MKPSVFVDYLKENKVTISKNPSIKLLIKYKRLAGFKDLPIIISALESKCDYLVTGNIKDFNLRLSFPPSF